MLELKVRVSYKPEHFNRVCNATVPSCWTAETNHPEGDRVYGLDQWSSKDAITDLINQLKKDGLSGTLKISRVHNEVDQKNMDNEAMKDLYTN